MNRWAVKITAEARKDIVSLGNPHAGHVKKALMKVSTNPLPSNEGGYGKPLGNKNGVNLTGLYKAKLREDGIRIVYRLERSENEMIVLVVGIRDDSHLYKEAARRINK